MKILIVGMIDSIHLARWIRQLDGLGWQIGVFPSTNSENIHPKLKKRARVHHADWLEFMITNRAHGPLRIVLSLLKLVFSRLAPAFDRCARLRTVIRRASPDIIHSLETQNAGYLVDETKRRFFQSSEFPPWIHTNWGSDIFLYGRLADHEKRIRGVLRNCDYYCCESERDVRLARAFGFSKVVAAQFPNSGGFDTTRLRNLRENLAPSRRKEIMLKGYQGWAGRALVSIKALDLVGGMLKGYRVNIYSSMGDESVRIAGELLAQHTGVEVRILPNRIDHERMLEYFAASRIYIGLSISDAISTSLLEAMATGAFPIQSDTSTADEWIVDPESGAIVPPEEPVEVARRVSEALVNDALVDNAAAANWEVIVRRANADLLKKKTIEVYERVLADSSRGMRKVEKGALVDGSA